MTEYLHLIDEERSQQHGVNTARCGGLAVPVARCDADGKITCPACQRLTWRAGMTVEDLQRAGRVGDAVIVVFDDVLEVASVTPRAAGGYDVHTVDGVVKAEGVSRVWLTEACQRDVAGRMVNR